MLTTAMLATRLRRPWGSSVTPSLGCTKWESSFPKQLHNSPPWSWVLLEKPIVPQKSPICIEPMFITLFTIAYHWNDHEPEEALYSVSFKISITGIFWFTPRSTARVRFPAVKNFFSSPRRPDRLWDPPLLSSGSLWIKRQRREADHSFPTSAEVANGGAILPLSDMSSWRSA
jgi:hypothetical protein